MNWVKSLPTQLSWHSALIASVLFSLSYTAAAVNNCPLLGPLYPEPTGLASNPAFKAASDNLTQQLQQITQTGSSAWSTVPSSNTSFTTGIFSLDTEELLFNFDWSAPNITLTPGSSKQIRSDLAMPIASVSKLVTVYTLLTEIGDDCWSRPVTDYLPELAAQAADQSLTFNPIDDVDWRDVTVGELASQLGNIPRQAVVCKSAADCSRSDFFQSFLLAPPNQASSTTAVYSDDAFVLLGYLLETVTGKPFRDVVKDNLLTPLGMDNSNLIRMSDDRMYLGNSTSRWEVPEGQSYGAYGPSGGVFSSVEDLAKMGRSILNSTLLTPAMTRRWLKPHSESTNLRRPVGAPWEMSRATVNGRVVDLYRKEGNVPGYTTNIALVPDFNIGLVDIAATDSPGIVSRDVNTAAVVLNQMALTMLPALDDIARDQAAAAFSGDYSNGTATVSIKSDPSIQGLNITQFSIGGVDVIELIGTKGSWPIQVTNLRSGQDIAFRAVTQSDEAPSEVPSVVHFECESWTGSYDGSAGIAPLADLFVFTVGEDGKAVSVQPRGLPGTTLKKIN